MSLYIRDNTVDELADEVMRKLGTKTKTEAVRVALQNELNRADDKTSVVDAIRLIRERVAARMGPHKVKFDEKAYMDEMWED